MAQWINSLTSTVYRSKETPLRFFILLLSLLALPLRPAVLYAQGSSSLAELLKSPNAGTRAKAAREIGQGGDASEVPALTTVLADPSVNVRREVVIALARIRAPQSIDGLISGTKDPDSGVRVLAVDGLVAYYTGENPETGFTAFLKKSYARRPGAASQIDVSHIEPGVRVDPKAIAALDAALNDTRVIEPARAAAHGLGVLLSRSSIPDLVKAAHSFDEHLSREALSALSKIKDPSAGPQLIDLLGSSNKAILEDAAVTVGVLRAQAAVSKLQSLYETDPDKKVRDKALEGLAYLGNPISIPIFTKALWSNDKTTRALGAEGLGRAGDPKSRVELQKAESVEKDAGARLAMDFALTALGSDNYLHGLIQGLDSTIRGDIAETYLVELARSPKILANLYPYLDSGTTTERKKLCDVLMSSGNESSVAPLERATHDKNDDVAAEALRALRVIRARLSATGSEAK
jgi:HEAT repeat protein